MECKWKSTSIRNMDSKIKIYPEWNVNKFMAIDTNAPDAIKIYPEWNVNFLL